MAKDKNHTNRNQGPKNHRNGIKKPKTQIYTALKGMNQRYIRNRRRAILCSRVAQYGIQIITTFTINPL